MARTIIDMQKDELGVAIEQILDLSDGKQYHAYYQSECVSSMELFREGDKEMVRRLLEQLMQHVHYHPRENFNKFVQGVKYIAQLYEKFGNSYMNLPHVLRFEISKKCSCLTIRYAAFPAYTGFENDYSSYASFSFEKVTEETHIIHSLEAVAPVIYDSTTT